MRLVEMIEKVEQINALKSELGVNGKAVVSISEKHGSSKHLSSLEDYVEFKSEYIEEIQDLLDRKKFSKVKDYFQLCDVYTIGSYTNIVEFEVEIYETYNY